MELREVRRVDDVGDLLEVVAAQVEVLKVPQVGEVLVEFRQSVCTDGQALQLAEFADVRAGAEAELEGVDVAVELQFFGCGEVFHLEGNPLLDGEHVEAGGLDTALERVDIPLHALFPECHAGPVVHSFAGTFPAGCPDFECAGDAEQGHGVAFARIRGDRLCGALFDGEFVVAGEHFGGHVALRGGDEGDFGGAFVSGVDAPVEADGDLARTEPVVESDVIAVELHPAGLVVGDLDVEIDIGPDLDVEVAFVERGVVFDIDRRLVERDGVIESLLFDPDFLVFGAVSGFDDTHDAVSDGVRDGRVDVQAALRGLVSVCRGYGDPGHVRDGDPVFIGRDLDFFRTSDGIDGNRVGVGSESDGFVGRGAGCQKCRCREERGCDMVAYFHGYSSISGQLMIFCVLS